jgi:cohesin loading factor subunit SCC2
LKLFYSVTDDINRRIDICTKLVMRMLDEDTTVKELAIKTIEDLWFQDVASNGQRPRSSTNIAHDKLQLLSKVTVIMAVSGNFKDRQSPLEDMLHRIMIDKDDNDALQLRERYVEICDTLIDGLVDASDLPGFVRTITWFQDV